MMKCINEKSSYNLVKQIKFSGGFHGTILHAPIFKPAAPIIKSRDETLYLTSTFIN